MTDDTAASHRSAAEQAEAQTLWEDAVREYEAALSLMAGSAPGDPEEGALLTALGRCYWNLSEARPAWRTLRRAMSLYAERGDGLGLARATVEIMRIWGPRDRQRQMARDAIEMLGNADPYLRARLLLSLRWLDEDGGSAALEEAIAIGERHGFADILAVRTQDQAWQAINEGRIDEGIALQEEAHAVYSAAAAYDPAAGTLRGAGFGTIAMGYLDRGEALARRAAGYAHGVHLRFAEQLALMDIAGVAYARAEYDRCRAVLDEMPGITDFRADLHRMWMVELTGDTRGALSLMVDPERGGGASTAISQTHGAAAGVLFRAGNRDAAKRELEAWFEVSRNDRSLAEELPALFECAVTLSDDSMLDELYSAYQHRPPEPPPPVFATLQGRAVAPSHGAVCMRLGRVDEAERVYREGAAWCARQRVPLDGALCELGLAEIAEARGDHSEYLDLRARAAATFEGHGARLYLDRMRAPPD
jgi:tetratricopeptide (TPR) repeat protein